jgi:threonine 3-dehydrogenase
MSGPTGANAVAVCKALKARQIIAIGGSEIHIDLARRMGANHVINRHECKDIVGEIRRLSDGKGVEVCLEFSGSATALEQCFDAVQCCGQISILGLYKNKIELDINKKLVLKDITVRGIYGRRIWDTWQLTAALLKQGMDVSAVVTHRYHGLTQFNEAFQLMREGKAGKCVFFPHNKQ